MIQSHPSEPAPLLMLSATPLVSEIDGSGSRRRVLALRQRAAIRAAARELLAERGYAGFHINDLAVRSDVAVQTLYNHFGGREEILSSSVEEHLNALIVWAHAESQRICSNFILVFADLSVRLMEADGAYIRAIVALLKDQENRPLLANQLEDRCIVAYRDHLLTMQEAGLLKRWVNIDSFARALQDILRTILTARIHPTDTARLRHEILMCAGLLLHGAARGSEAERVETLLDAALGKRSGTQKTFADSDCG